MKCSLIAHFPQFLRERDVQMKKGEIGETCENEKCIQNFV